MARIPQFLFLGLDLLHAGLGWDRDSQFGGCSLDILGLDAAELLKCSVT